MPDICHVITDRGVGGAGIFLTHLLADPTLSSGSLVLLPTESLLCSRLSLAGIPFATFPAQGEHSFSLAAVRELTKRLAALRPRLVVSHAALSARIAAKRLGIPTLSVRHCDTRVRALGVPLYNALTDATVATSAPAAVRLRLSGVQNVLMIENGVTPIGVPSADARKAARAALGIPDGQIAVGLAGRLARIKGHACALTAIARREARSKDVHLYFLGEGEERATLCRLARSLGVAERVHFLGYTADVRPFYHAMDAHISCSLGSETSSLSLAEGLSAACPTLASDTPGNRERVRDGGILFPVGDAARLSALLSELCEPAVRRRLARRAAQRARALPSWEATRRAYGQVFDAFCGELVQNGCIFRKDMI